ncbi:MAG: transposase [Ectothiorhodospiraceae bacterium]|nr:transposase [Ectothiorhodospiraceae bacterium]
MPRRARLAIPGIPWHIIQRGNNRSACFYAEDDYRRYLDTLREQAQKHGCLIHAYVLMTNHVHLLLTPEKPDSAALLMKHLGQRYVQYINRTYRRSGTLWEGRFRSCLARDEAYVLGCYRYIELNPVRATMVEHPRDYPWSSYRANGDGGSDPLLTPHPDYLRLGTTAEVRRDNYRALFTAHIEPELLAEIRHATNGNFALGSQRFKDEVAQMLGRRVVPGRSGRPRTGEGEG